MRFICPELIKNNYSDYISQLFKTGDINKEADQDMSGNNMPKVSTITQEKNKPVYTFGTTDLSYLYQSFDYDDTSARTIADLSSDIGQNITNYTDLSTEGFTFQFQNILNQKKPFKSSFWYTIITDAGLVFAKPKRQSTSNQIATFTVVGRNKKSSEFDNVSYQGESGADLYISADVDIVVPDTIDSKFKTMNINKFKSSNDVLIIRSNYNALPLDFVVHDNLTFLIVNKKQLTQDVKPLYEYMCVKEVDESYTISGADITPPVHPLIGTSAGGSVALNDLTDVTITSVANDNILQYNSTSGKWENAAPSGGANTTVLGTEQTLFNATGQQTDQLVRFNLGMYDKADETDTSGDGIRAWKIKITISVTASVNTVRVRAYFISGFTAATTTIGAEIIDNNRTIPGTQTTVRTMFLPHGAHNIFIDWTGSAPQYYDINIVGKEISLDDVIY